MKTNAGSIVAADVKVAFTYIYEDISVACEQVGELLNDKKSRVNIMEEKLNKLQVENDEEIQDYEESLDNDGTEIKDLQNKTVVMDTTMTRTYTQTLEDKSSTSCNK